MRERITGMQNSYTLAMLEQHTEKHENNYNSTQCYYY